MNISSEKSPQRARFDGARMSEWDQCSPEADWTKESIENCNRLTSCLVLTEWVRIPREGASHPRFVSVCQGDRVKFARNSFRDFSRANQHFMVSLIRVGVLCSVQLFRRQVEMFHSDWEFRAITYPALPKCDEDYLYHEFPLYTCTMRSVT